MRIPASTRETPDLKSSAMATANKNGSTQAVDRPQKCGNAKTSMAKLMKAKTSRGVRSLDASIMADSTDALRAMGPPGRNSSCRQDQADADDPSP
mmetsp:Transcript_85872/g.119211  ORF Transcript_85872/g.119211 Transcript_85872/m.119211 type:complete len:95 (-) Transcript_85872:231-515(-)